MKKQPKIPEHLPLINNIEFEVKKAFKPHKIRMGNWRCNTRADRWEVSAELTDPGPINFLSVKNLSEAIGTESIDIGGWRKTDGCDTCDFGSETFLDVNICYYLNASQKQRKNK